MSTDKGAYGLIVKARRKQLGLSQEALGERVGVARAYFAQLETGRIRLPEQPLRLKIAEALGYTDAELLRLAGYDRAPEDSPTPEEVAIRRSPVMALEDPPPADPLARIEELLPLLDERQCRSIAVQMEFMLGLRS